MWWRFTSFAVINVGWNSYPQACAHMGHPIKNGLTSVSPFFVGSIPNDLVLNQDWLAGGAGGVPSGFMTGAAGVTLVMGT